MTSQQVITNTSDNILNTYARFPIAISHGKGARLYDFEGREYIDFTAGLGVNAIGYGNEAWGKAIAEQAAKLGHISNLYHTAPPAKLAETLCQRTGMAKIFFANSGGESNEGLIKLARKYSFDKYGKGRQTIVTLVNSFHGRTVTTLAATGQDVFHNYFFPFTEGFRHAPAGALDMVKAACGDDTCAIMLELVQGEGGVLPLSQEFVTGVAAFCRERDLLLLIDEIQTGIGRTGSLFAYQQYGLTPDAVSFAKGIAGGLPFGGFMTNERCEAVLGPGTHATTFGGNPICAAAALCVLDILDDTVLGQVAEKGAYIREKVASMHSPYVTGTRGLGLMIGIGVQNASHKELAARLNEAGLLCLTAGAAALRFLPPLTITYEEIDAGLTIFESVMKNQGDLA